MEGYQQGGGGRTGEMVQGIRNIDGRYKIDRGRLSIVFYYSLCLGLCWSSLDAGPATAVG